MLAWNVKNWTLNRENQSTIPKSFFPIEKSQMRDLIPAEREKTYSLFFSYIFDIDDIASNKRLKSSNGDGGTVLLQIDTVPI
jgi:hypothetical protein